MIRLAMLALPLILCGCASVIKSVDLTPGQTPALNKDVEVVIDGTGSCDLSIDWGDGSQKTTDTGVQLSSRPTYKHTFRGWPGGRTITVEPASTTNCSGFAQTRFVTTPAVTSLGWARDPMGNTLSCVAFPGKPALPPSSRVTVTSPPAPVVNFGCGNNGCIYDADGKPGSSAVAPFEFPGFREYSLLFRLGNATTGTMIQGGRSTQFMANGQPLFFCQNNDRPMNNITGGWEIDIRVDELGPAP